MAQGSWEYSQKCPTCHGAQLQGSGAPALTGWAFNLQWNGKTLRDLYSYVHRPMPLGSADSLKGQEYADILAYILTQSWLPAGNERFTPSSPMDRVLALSDSAASVGAQPAATGPPAKIGELIGALKQPTSSKPTQAERDAAESSTTNWLMYNKGYRGERYSLLRRQINVKNAKSIHPVCMFQLGELGTFPTGPVVYDGILFATTHLGTYAVDATTRRKLWSHQHVAQAPERNATKRRGRVRQRRRVDSPLGQCNDHGVRSVRSVIFGLRLRGDLSAPEGGPTIADHWLSGNSLNKPGSILMSGERSA